MKTRATILLTLVAGQPLAAQEVFQVHYSWIEVHAGTANPVSAPNGILEPGEGARIRIGVTALANGVSAIGQVTTYPAPFPPNGNGTGTIKGLGSVGFDIVGDNNAPTAFGTWNSLQGPEEPLRRDFHNGLIQPGGATIVGVGGVQFIAPEATANGFNNNVRVSQGVWNPASYSPRTVNFTTRPSVLSPPTQHSSLLLAYGCATAIDPNTQQVFTYDLYLFKYIGAEFGAGVSIPIVPTPSALALLGLGAIAAGARRRADRRDQP